MRRTFSTRQSLLVIGMALVAGVGTGVAGHAITDSGSPPHSPSSTGPSSGDPSTTPQSSGLLGPGNVLATTDFTRVGWFDVKEEVLTDGEPQFLYSCERRQLRETGIPTATIDASWSRQHALSAAETVGQMTTAPQAHTLFGTLSGWYDHCTQGRPGSGRVTPSTLLGTVRGTFREAHFWRIGASGDQTPTYAILARNGDRLALLDLYADLSPPDPAGLRALAQRTIMLLG